MKKNLFILILFSLLPVITWAQESISVKGVVFDNLNMTVPGASVVEKGTQNGTVTDMDGNFTLHRGDPVPSRLVPPRRTIVGAAPGLPDDWITFNPETAPESACAG